MPGEPDERWKGQFARKPCSYSTSLLLQLLLLLVSTNYYYYYYHYYYYYYYCWYLGLLGGFLDTRGV